MGAWLTRASEDYPNEEVKQSALLHRNIRAPPHRFVSSYGNVITTDNGWKIFDASGGAGVSCIGHGNKRVIKATTRQMEKGTYACSLMFDTDVAEEFAQFLVRSTDGMMTKVTFQSSGSEAVEGMKKLTIQYFAKEKKTPEPSRTLFIARERSYHGATLGALALSGHKARKEIYKPVLNNSVHHISPCYPYRDQKLEETVEDYVARLKEELRNKFIELGPKNVAGFIAEPIVGAALGCVSALPGYLAAMKDVCREFGALFLLDEVMCGMGRCGYLHAWQEEGVVPDIQTLGKGLGGGYQAISAILIGKKVAGTLESGSAVFNHGHTYQNLPVACAAGLEVQKIIQEGNMLQNVREKGALLYTRLVERLGDHPNVGEIRGKGLFWGIEFVMDKTTKEPFDSKDMVGFKLFQEGLKPPYNIHVYPGAGSVEGTRGDHIILAPAYNITVADVNLIVERVGSLVEDFFARRGSKL